MSEGEKSSIRFVLPKWLKQSDRPISAIDIHPSGEFFATGGWDNFCKIWNFNVIINPEEDVPNKLLAVLRDHTKPINAVCFSPDGKYLAKFFAQAIYDETLVFRGMRISIERALQQHRKQKGIQGA